MAQVTQADLDAVLAKMDEGDFIAVFLVKGGPSSGDDEIVSYPATGLPMTQEDVDTVFTGFLAQHRVQLDETPNEKGDAYLNADEEGHPLPMYTGLEWLVKWLKDHFRGASTRGLRKLQAQATNPMPE